MRFCAFLVFLLVSWSAQAWNARGHMIMAAIAYQQLSTDKKTTITEILKLHPEYNRTWKPSYDNLRDEADLGLYLFMQASVWPDNIRDHKHPQHQYNGPRWHYMNYELRFPYNGSTDIVDQYNVLQAIHLNQEKYRSATCSPQEKAISLCWIIHLVGDIHQPLHSVSLFSQQYPKGDRGGNQFWVRDRGSVNLHYYWDGLLGRSTGFRDVLNEVVLLKSEVQPTVESSECDPTAWSLESFKLAREKVYLDGKLKGGATKKEAAPLPDDYGMESRKVGEKRIALAGYRLANIL
jgi:hypothetical protein